MKKIIITFSILLLATIFLVGCASVNKNTTTNKQQANEDVVMSNSNQKTNMNDYGNAEDYLLSDSEIESAGFILDRQIMSGPVTSKYDDVNEARMMIQFSDSNLDEGGNDLQQIVRVFPNTDKALIHFESRRNEELSLSSPSMKVTEFSDNFGDKSYAFHRIEELPNITHSYVHIIFVKDNIYVELVSPVNDEDYNKKMLQLGSLVENKV